jgi:hypothetical protein
MRLSAASLLASVLLITGTLSSIAEEKLSGAEIERLIAGKRVYLATPYGLEFPLVYRNDGSVVGDASGFRLATLITPRETGHWWIENDRLCQQWPTWYDGRTFCFVIARTGSDSLAWTRDDGLQGTARIDG